MRKINNPESSIRLFLEKYGLALAPALAYYLAYEEEKAFCKVFGIPGNFIQIDLATVLLFTSMVIGAGFYLLIFVEAAYDALTNKDDSSRAAVQYGAFLALILTIALLYGFSHWKSWIFWVLGILSIFFMDLQHAKFEDQGKPLLQRLKGPIEIWSPAPSTFGSARKILKGLFPIFLVIYSALAIAREMGRSAALNQTDFLTPSTVANSFVVRKYGDMLICCKFDPAQKVLNPGFFVIHQGGAGSISFENKHIGPFNFD